MSTTYLEAWCRLAAAERTDRAKVLLGLYFLHAVPGGAWVPATQIAELVRLNLGKKSPQNTSDVLRKAGADVQPQRGPDGGLLWQLSPTGRAKMVDWGIIESEPQLVVAGNSARSQFDVAILCALAKPELSAVMAAFGGTAAWKSEAQSGFPRVCRTTNLQVMTGGDVKIVAALATTMGLTGAAIAASQMIAEFRPKLVLMIGIAAGTKGGERNFGDILVPDPSVDYASGKIVEKDGVKSLEPDPYPIVIDAKLKSLLQLYQDSVSPFDEIRQSWSGVAPRGAPKLHLGPVGAADQVVDAESIVKEVKRNWRKLIGVEMETYGVYRAAHESASRPVFAAFKSVCDFAAQKNDDYQPYAAHTAAHFARYFVARHWSEIQRIAGG